MEVDCDYIPFVVIHMTSIIAMFIDETIKVNHVYWSLVLIAWFFVDNDERWLIIHAILNMNLLTIII